MSKGTATAVMTTAKVGAIAPQSSPSVQHVMAVTSLPPSEPRPVQIKVCSLGVLTKSVLYGVYSAAELKVDISRPSLSRYWHTRLGFQKCLFLWAQLMGWGGGATQNRVRWRGGVAALCTSRSNKE